MQPPNTPTIVPYNTPAEWTRARAALLDGALLAASAGLVPLAGNTMVPVVSFRPQDWPAVQAVVAAVGSAQRRAAGPAGGPLPRVTSFHRWRGYWHNGRLGSGIRMDNRWVIGSQQWEIPVWWDLSRATLEMGLICVADRRAVLLYAGTIQSGVPLALEKAVYLSYNSDFDWSAVKEILRRLRETPQ